MNGAAQTARRGTFELRRMLAGRVDDLLGGSRPLLGGRAEAGLQLRLLLPADAYRKPVVLAIPPGGVLVAEPIADQLNAPLDVVVVEMLRLPGETVTSPLGAIAPGTRRLLGPEELRALSVQAWAPDFLAECEQDDLDRLENVYRSGRTSLDLAGRTAVVVDDGLTPSLGLLAALDSVRLSKPDRVIVVAPLVPDPLLRQLLDAGFEVVRLLGDEKERSGLSSLLYGDEPPPSDGVARAALVRAARRIPGSWQR
ncbi:MAG TPA: phosphoribosyltransferase family protein [Thermoanaerobaculia bacterium]